MKPHGYAFRRIIGYSELTYPGLSLKHILGKPLALCLECSMGPKTKAIRPQGNCSSSGRKHTDSLILHITAYLSQDSSIRVAIPLNGLLPFLRLLICLTSSNAGWEGMELFHWAKSRYVAYNKGFCPTEKNPVKLASQSARQLTSQVYPPPLKRCKLLLH